MDKQLGRITFIQRTRPKQRRLQEFLQSKAWQEDTFIHCFLILKDQFGAVDTMLKDNWDWETTQTETKQKRLQDFQESTQFQQEIITLILLMKREVFGCVDTITVDNLGWDTQPTKAKQ